MDSIKSWLDPKIPVEYIIGSFIVLCLVILFGTPFFKGYKAKNFVLLSLCSEYYFLVLCSTVLCRTLEVEKRVELIPFYKYPNIWNRVDYPNDLMEVSLNIVLFVPIGLLLSGNLRNRKWWHIVIVGFSLSLIIELLQLITGKGHCETDDLIHNTLGACVGWAFYNMIKKTTRYASPIR